MLDYNVLEFATDEFDTSNFEVAKSGAVKFNTLLPIESYAKPFKIMFGGHYPDLSDVRLLFYRGTSYFKFNSSGNEVSLSALSGSLYDIVYANGNTVDELQDLDVKSTSNFGVAMSLYAFGSDKPNVLCTLEVTEEIVSNLYYTFDPYISPFYVEVRDVDVTDLSGSGGTITPEVRVMNVNGSWSEFSTWDSSSRPSGIGFQVRLKYDPDPLMGTMYVHDVDVTVSYKEGLFL